MRHSFSFHFNAFHKLIIDMYMENVKCMTTVSIFVFLSLLFFPSKMQFHLCDVEQQQRMHFSIKCSGLFESVINISTIIINLSVCRVRSSGMGWTQTVRELRSVVVMVWLVHGMQYTSHTH